jgi:hypothetical protein
VGGDKQPPLFKVPLTKTRAATLTWTPSKADGLGDDFDKTRFYLSATAVEMPVLSASSTAFHLGKDVGRRRR